MLAATGLGLSALRLALARLESARLLVLEVRGHRRGPNAHESTPVRANAYRLGNELAMSTYQYPKNGSVVPQALFCSAPGDNVPGAPDLLCRAPHEEGPLMVTLTLSAASPEALAEAWAALHASRDVQVTEQSAPAAEGNVLPIRRPAPERRPA